MATVKQMCEGCNPQCGCRGIHEALEIAEVPTLSFAEFQSLGSKGCEYKLTCGHMDKFALA